MDFSRRGNYEEQIRKSKGFGKSFDSITNWAQIGVDIGLGFLSLIPGLDLIPALIMGIDLTFATLRTVNDVKRGEINAINVGVDFGSALLVGIGPVVSEAKDMKLVAKNVGRTLVREPAIGRFVKESLESTYKTFKDQKALFEEAVDVENFSEKYIKETRRVIKENIDTIRIDLKFYQDEARVNKELEQATLEGDIEAMIKLKETLENLRWRKMKEFTQRSVYSKASVIEAAEKEFDKLKDFRFARKYIGYSRQKMIDQLKLFMPALKDSEIASLFTSQRKIKLITKRTEAETKFFKLLSDERLTEAEKAELATVIRQATPNADKLRFYHQSINRTKEGVKTGEFEPKTFEINSNVRGLHATVMNAFYKLPGWAKDMFENNPKRFAATIFTYSYRMKYAEPVIDFLRRTGSMKFNEKWVQKLQLIDPNDFGRAPVEWAYGRLKKIIQKQVRGETKRKPNYIRKIAEKADRAISKYEEMEKAFEREGGHVVPRNRYLLGFTIVPSLVKTPSRYQTLVLRFNHYNTSSETGKNVGGKKDVVVLARHRDIIGLQQQGVRYYWEHGHKLGWYFSRGGKDKFSQLEAIDADLSLFLGFAHIGWFRNIPSIVSNWVENGSDIVAGTYFSSYERKFVGSFLRSVLNRSARLMTRVGLGEVSTKFANTRFNQDMLTHKISNYLLSNVGREMQRISIASLSLVVRTNKETGVYEYAHISGQKALTKLKNTAMNVSKTHVIRIGRRSGVRSFQHQHKIKFGYIRRIGSSTTPNSIVSPRRIGKIRIG